MGYPVEPQFYSNSGELGSATNPTTGDALAAQRSNQIALLDLAGLSPQKEIMIQDDVITPTGAFCVVDTESQSSQDSIQIINHVRSSLDTIHDGMVLYIRQKDENRSVSVLNSTAVGGVQTLSGQTQLLGVDWWMCLQYVNGKWVQFQTTAPIKSATEAILGLIQTATTPEATAGTNDTKAMTPLKTAQAIEPTKDIAEYAVERANTAIVGADSAYTLANTANTTANTAKTNAQTAQNTAIAAQNTANTANMNAQTAQNTANTIINSGYILAIGANFIKFSNSLIIQWGTFSSIGNNSVIFPVAMTTTTYTATSGNSSNLMATVRVSNKYTTQMTVFTSSTPQQVGNFDWMIIGY